MQGFTFPVRRLDGKVLLVSNAEDQIIKPAALMAIDNEGMPIRGAGEYTRGNLFVQFTVKFPEPDELTPEQTVLLKRTLPPKPDVVFDDEMVRACRAAQRAKPLSLTLCLSAAGARHSLE